MEDILSEQGNERLLELEEKWGGRYRSRSGPGYCLIALSFFYFFNKAHSCFAGFVKKVMSIDLVPYDWTSDVKKIKAPLFMAIGDADGIRYEHALELFRAKGGGKMGDINGLPQSRLAILPGTTHIGMMYQNNVLIPMITEFLDSDLNTAPPMF